MMIRRVFKELWAVHGIFVICLIIMFILSLGLSVFNLNNYMAESCGMDIFSFVSEGMPVSVFLISSFIGISINKNNFKPERVVISKNNSSVWNYTVIKTIIMSLITSVFIFLITFLAAKIFFTDFFNWNTNKSVFFRFTGKLKNDISYAEIFIAYFFQSFFGICTAAIMPLVSFWYFKSYMIGAFAIIILNLAGMSLGADFIYGQNVSYDNILTVIDIRYHFIFPAVVLVIFMVVGRLKTKRDFI